VPLLIGGATTSKAHTAVRIAPRYDGPVLHVSDASLVTGVCSALLNAEQRDAYLAKNRAEQERSRTHFEQTRKTEPQPIPIAEARARGFSCDWASVDLPQPPALGLQLLDGVPLDLLASYIDWSPFFWVWELHGVFPKILDHPKHGAQARELHRDALRILDEVIAGKLFHPRAAFGLWPANSVGDDVEVYAPDERERAIARFHFLRQQTPKEENLPHLCLADFIAPKPSGRTDFIGAFALTAGREVELAAAERKAAGDDYTAIILQALGDRFAEALAEHLHKLVRDQWGFGNGEGFSASQAPDAAHAAALLREEYRGIRPAAGYPACPDHTEKATIWSVLDAERRTGISLTVNFAMAPPCSVSGLYFAHPHARYFPVGKIGRDQVEDYARRKGIQTAEAERWLAPILAYQPVPA
jgi:5-methyltetrahydrofolate--homocysteine methyltransferase